MNSNRIGQPFTFAYEKYDSERFFTIYIRKKEIPKFENMVSLDFGINPGYLLFKVQN